MALQRSVDKGHNGGVGVDCTSSSHNRFEEGDDKNEHIVILLHGKSGVRYIGYLFPEEMSGGERGTRL